MEMLTGGTIAEAGLVDWRKLAQGLHARYLVADFASAVQFLGAVADAGATAGHHPRATVGEGIVDLEPVSADAVFRADDGTEHVVEWVTQQDIDLARRITEIAAAQGRTARPDQVTEIELGLDTADPGAIAPMWAALMTGNPEDQGRGTPGDEIRDAHARVPNLWFADPDADNPSPQRFHVEVYVAPEVVEERIAAAVAAGGVIVDDSLSPRLTVIADPQGNKGVICSITPS